MFVSEDTGVNPATRPIVCIDVTTGVACTGWSTPKDFLIRNIVNHHDANGVADGVCAVNSTESKCVTDAAPGTVITAGPWPIVDDYYSVSEEAELGTKTLFATGLGDSGMACWDWTTNASCTGGRWDAFGASRFDGASNPLPQAYGATSDGTSRGRGG